MIDMTDDARVLARLTELLESAAEGEIIAAADLQGQVRPEIGRLRDAAELLLNRVRGLQQMALSLGQGEIEIANDRSNRLLDPLKSLQGSLRHLTWQTQEIAAGKLEQRVDFLGDFSVAFNHMIESLREKQRTDQEAMEASRMAGLGQLAGGIAHEINNPLQSLQSNVQFLGEAARALGDLAALSLELAARATRVPSLAASAEHLMARVRELDTEFLVAESPDAERDALEGLKRIGTVVHAVMSFTNATAIDGVETRLDQLLDEVLTVAQPLSRERALVERCFDAALPAIRCRPDELHDALLRLVTNAVQAIVESGKPPPGSIRIETRLAGRWAEIRVSDSGHGVPKELRTRIFDPFFTTRDVGKGMGLGLTVCRDIVVSRHRGSLEVTESPLGGACFVVRLPLGVDDSVKGNSSSDRKV
ncbi:MAG: hypothetical protein IT581_23265 [Verrucomicrobiales bacterium]|nr:hypothetical protein [Verrucomicrobiales bacterium]